MQPVLKASFAEGGGSAEDGRPSPPSAPEDSPVVSAAVGLHAVVTHGQLMRTFVSGPNGDGMLADPGTAEAPWKRLHVDPGHDSETLRDGETSARQQNFPCGSNCCLLPPLAACLAPDGCSRCLIAPSASLPTQRLFYLLLSF